MWILEINGVNIIEAIERNTINEFPESLIETYNETLDKLNPRMGRDTVKIAVQGFGRDWQLRQERKSRCYTTRWQELLEVEALG